MAAKRTAFGDFLRTMAKESHLAEDKIREILKGVGYQSFEPHKTALYRTAVMSYCLHMERALTVAKQQPEPCPITSCVGYKDRGDQFWPWTCTVGGLRHFLVAKATILSGIRDLVLLEKINAVHSEKELEIQEARQKSMELSAPRSS